MSIKSEWLVLADTVTTSVRVMPLLSVITARFAIRVPLNIGAAGDQNGAVYKITIGRPDIEMREHGALVNSRMGLNTWAAFTGRDADAMVAGDVAMLEHEVTPVLAALRANGLDIVAIHHHMTDTRPVVIFLHYYGTGPAVRLAQGIRAALDLLGKGAPAR